MNGSGMDRLFASLLAGVLLAGCASENPREGGFLGGVAGLSSGAYEERVRTRQDSLVAVKEANRDLESEQSALESQKAASARKVQAERRKLKQLATDTQRLSDKVKALKASDTQQGARIADLQRRTAALDGKVQAVNRPSRADALEGGGGGAAVQDAHRQQLETQRRQLEEEYRLLSDMYRKLGS
jgi:Skp family chaperone for outer membrane proteins